MSNYLASYELWQIFMGLGCILVLAEAIVPGLIMMPLGIGFILAAPIAYLTSDKTIVYGLFALFQLSSIYLTRRIMKRLMKSPKILTGVDAMIGQEAIVTESIAPGGVGYVKLYGDRWAARSFNEKEIAKGEAVVITKIEGNKVWVEPLNNN